MTVNNKSAQQLDDLIRETTAHRELTPTKDLWRGIEMSISRQQVTRQKPWYERRSRAWDYLLATAATLFVGVGVVLSLQSGGIERGTDSSTLNLLAVVTEQHQQQREFLLTNYEQAGFQPTFAELENELQQLQQATVQVVEQLRKEPENSELWQFLQWLHQQELEVLKTMYLQPRGYQEA